MTARTDGFLNSPDGLQIYHRAWLPDGEPRAVVLLIHGLGEHSGRYENLATALTGDGHAVLALDLRGHGRSEGKRGFVKRYEELTDDLAMFRHHAEGEHPGVPLVLLGHSMGGNLVLGHALDHQAGLAGMALSGPLLDVGSGRSAITLAILKLVARVAPGFRPPETVDADTLSKDPAVVDAYRNDPLVYTGRVSAGLAGALIGAIERFPRRYGELTLPILVMHGTADRLVDIRGSRALEAAAVNANVTAHYYEGLFHEIFNEPEREMVHADLLSWLDAHVSVAS